MTKKVETTFVDIQQKMKSDFEDLREFVHLQMYLPLKKSEKLIEAHEEYLQQMTKTVELIRRESMDL